MTDEELRALDAKTAEQVMGWTEVTTRRTADRTWTGICHSGVRPYVDDIPHYSTEIEAAWLVVEELHKWDMGIELNSYPDNVCEYWILKRVGDHFEHYENGEESSAPLAICRAALRVVGDE